MRQSRDKADPGPEYEHIPRDAKGDPVFLILPDGVRASYDRKMPQCEAGWRATGDPWAVSQAHTLTRLHRQVAPLWLDDAVFGLAARRRTRAHDKRAHEAEVRLMRYMAVRDAHAEGLSFEKAYVHAAKALPLWNPAIPRVSANTMRLTYQTVKKDLKAGRGGRYFKPFPRGLTVSPARPYGKPD